MANNTNAVDAVVAQEAIKQVENLTLKLSQADAELIKISESALKAGKSISTISTPSGMDKAISNTSELNAELAKQNKQIEALQAQITKLSQVRAINNKMSAEEAVNQRILNKNALDEAKSISKLVGEYDKLNIKHQQAVRNAQNLGATYGSTSKQFKEASDKANVLDKELKDLDSTLGKSQRNVGNYGNSFNSLGSTLNQLGIITGVGGIIALGQNALSTSKELQSLNLALMAVTGTQEEFAKQQLFLSGISNKYGLEIKGLTEQFTQFYVSAKGKLAGKDIQEVFENISKSGSALGLSNDTLKRSFMALNQMLSKGKVASEELRGQLAEALPGSEQAMTRAVQKLHPEIKNLTEKGLFEMIKAGQILAEEVLPETSRQLVLLTGADKAQGIEILTKLTNRFVNSWSKMIQSINDSDSSGFAVFVKSIVGGLTTIMDFTGLLFKNENQLQDYFKNIGKQKGLEEFNNIIKNISSTTKENQEATKKELLFRERENIRVNQAIIKSEKEKRASLLGGDRAFGHLQTKKEEDALVSLGKSLAVIKSLKQSELEIDKKQESVVKELTKEELKAIEDRLKALYDANRKELELQLVKTDLLLNNEDKYYTDRLTALNKDYSIRLQIAKLDFDEHFRLSKDDKNKKRSAEIDYQISLLNISEEYGKKRIALEKLQIKPKGVTQTTPKDTLKESSDNAIKQLQRQGEAVQKLNEFYKELQKSTDDWLKSFSSDALQNSGLGSLETFFDGTFNKLLLGASNSKEKFAVYFNAIAESAQEAFNFISNASQQNFDSERERLQSQYDVSLKYAGDNKAAQEKLGEDLEKKKKDIATREAKAKQKQAIFNIAIDTAQAIVGLWASPGFPAAIPLSILVGALGVAQIAMVSSQKIPQYFEGGVHNGGLAMINDAGGSNYVETVVTPDGKAKQYSGRDVVTNLPSGTEIFTPEQWREKQLEMMLNEKGISMSQNYNPNNGMTSKEMDVIMAKHFSKIQVNNTTFDKNGIRSWSERNGNKTINSNARGAGTGFKV